MKITSVESVKTGQVLAKSILSSDGLVLVPSGFPLTEDQITLLRESGVNRVFLLEPTKRQPAPGAMLRQLARQAIEYQVSLAPGPVGSNKTLLEHCTHTNLQTRVLNASCWAGARCKAQPAALNESQSRVLTLLVYAVEEILPLLMAFPTKLLTEARIEAYLDTAILALVVGNEYTLTDKELRPLAMASLTHDLGMLLIEPLRSLPADSLVGDEKMILREHPCLSASLVQGIFPGSVATQKILLRHHERLDGSGYPQGTKSAGLPPDSPQADLITRLSDILAVMTEYQALLLGEGGTTPCGPHEANCNLSDLAGTKLNLSVVQTLCTLTQCFPNGSRVRIRSNTSGRYVGFSGLVKQTVAESGPLPVKVLTLTENQKEKLPTPLDVDFSGERHLLLEMVS